MEKIKNICRDLGKAFTIGLLSGGAAAAVLLLGGSSLRFLGAVGGSGGLSFVSDVKIVSINKKRILQTVKMRSGKILFFRLVVIRLRDGR